MELYRTSVLGSLVLVLLTALTQIISACPDGMGSVQLSPPTPCMVVGTIFQSLYPDVYSCKGVSSPNCQDDFCGDRAKMHYVDSTRVRLTRNQCCGTSLRDTTQCPEQCTTGSICSAWPGAKCETNRCNDCKAEWYLTYTASNGITKHTDVTRYC